MALKISRILHAGYVFECDEIQIAFDPIFENPFSHNCFAFPAVQFDQEQIKNLNFSAVFISHFHDDHCSFESLNFLDRRTPIFIYCLHHELLDLIRELGFTNVNSLKINSPVMIGPFEVIPRRALDSDVDSIFQIKAAGCNILNVVDSWIDPMTLGTLSRSGPWDMVLWPFQTMREIEVLTPTRSLPPPNELPPEWIEQLKILNPRYVVPSSCQFIHETWSWYNHRFFPISYRQFETEITLALPSTQVVRMNPSVAFEFNQNALTKSSPLSWVLPEGEQDVDYDFKNDFTPPTTAEIAKEFLPLTEAQEKRVFDYCRIGLIEKFESMPPSEEKYFFKPRVWSLSLCNHLGAVTKFIYFLNGTKIKLIHETAGPLAWATEVPMAKLFGALEYGESLSSMYMRINDVSFVPEIEKEIRSVDVVEDPLVRCLFNGVFAAYQIAQLKKIRSLIAPQSTPQDFSS